jgi:hypothetical protein
LWPSSLAVLPLAGVGFLTVFFFVVGFFALFGSEYLLDLGQVVDFVLVGNADVGAESQPQCEFGKLNVFQPIRN